MPAPVPLGRSGALSLLPSEGESFFSHYGHSCSRLLQPKNCAPTRIATVRGPIDTSRAQSPPSPQGKQLRELQAQACFPFLIPKELIIQALDISPQFRLLFPPQPDTLLSTPALPFGFQPLITIRNKARVHTCRSGVVEFSRGKTMINGGLQDPLDTEVTPTS